MDKILNRGAWKMARFVCDCLDAGHNLTVTIEERKDGKTIHCGFELFLAGKTPLRYRIKQAWQCLRGKDGALGEFILRPEDYPEMTKFLSSLL